MSVRSVLPALGVLASLIAIACQPPVPEPGDTDVADTDVADTGSTDTGAEDTGETFDTADSAV